MREENYKNLVQEINTTLERSRDLIEQLRTPQLDFIFKDLDLNQFDPQITSIQRRDGQNFNQSHANLQSSQNEARQNSNCNQKINILEQKPQPNEKSSNLQSLEQMLSKYFQQSSFLMSEATDPNQDSYKLNFKRKIPITSISEALEKEEEEESNKELTPNGNKLYYFCQQQKKEKLLSQLQNKVISQPPSSINSEKYIQQQQNDFSLDLDMDLDFLNEGVKEKQNKQDYYTKNDNENRYLKQIKRFQSTASESQFEEELEENSLHLSEIEYEQKQSKQCTIISENTLQNTKHQTMLNSNSNLHNTPQTLQNQPYLLQITSFDHSSNDDSLVSFQNDHEDNSSVFELQNSNLLKNFFEDDMTSKQQQKPYIPTNVSNPIIDSDMLYSNQQDDMEQILSPLYSNQFFIDQANFQLSTANCNALNDEVLMNQKLSQSQCTIDNDQRMQQLEKELELLNCKITNNSPTNSTNVISPLLKSLKLSNTTHSRIKSSIVSIQDSASTNVTSRKASFNNGQSQKSQCRQIRAKQSLDLFYKSTSQTQQIKQNSFFDFVNLNVSTQVNHKQNLISQSSKDQLHKRHSLQKSTLGLKEQSQKRNSLQLTLLSKIYHASNVNQVTTQKPKEQKKLSQPFNLKTTCHFKQKSLNIQNTEKQIKNLAQIIV